MTSLVLASSSPYRKELLQRLELEFSTASPDIDETPHQGESPEQLVERLAIHKAKALAPQFPNSLLIGSDQVAVLEGNIMGKPGTREKAIEQLTACNGKSVHFLTGLCLYDSSNESLQSLVEPFTVYFRELSPQAIERYIDKEQPLNCAGSFKSEGLGVSLFRALEGRDPNALIGLPIIGLLEMLRNKGIEVP